jgi:hypothetical protein
MGEFTFGEICVQCNECGRFKFDDESNAEPQPAPEEARDE